MAGDTKISWASKSWNPLRGCSRADTACDRCYAMVLAHRWRDTAAFSGLTRDTRHGVDWTGEVKLVEKDLEVPLRWRTPERIFTNSVSDLWHRNVPTDYVARIGDTMKRAEWHRFMSLTKRPERMRELLNGELAWMGNLDHAEWGTSIGTRETLYRRDLLRDTNARVRFLSLEPLIEDLGDVDFRGIDQVIVGCESGKGARPMNEDWARRIRDQAKAAGAAFFYKQRLENGHKVETPELDGRRWTEQARPLGWGSTRPAPEPPATLRVIEQRDDINVLF